MKVKLLLILFVLASEFLFGQSVLRTSDGKIVSTAAGKAIMAGCSGMVSDSDGNIYSTVLIGTQCWLGENLRVTKLNNNALLTAPPIWNNTAAYAWHSKVTTAQQRTDCGALYTNEAIGTGKICPAGWHVPSDSEWNILASFLGGSSVAGGKMKETASTYWVSNVGATNSSGFTGRGCGDKYDGGGDGGFGAGTFFWSQTTSASGRSYWNLNASTIQLNGPAFSDISVKRGFSIRCVKD